MAKHQVSTKPTILHAFVLYGYMYPHKTNHVDIFTICVENYDYFLSERFDTCKFLHIYCIIVLTNRGKYQVSVKHTTVSILYYCCFYVLVHDRPILPCIFIFCVDLYQIPGVISPGEFHRFHDAVLNVPS